MRPREREDSAAGCEFFGEPVYHRENWLAAKDARRLRVGQKELELFEGDL